MQLTIRTERKEEEKISILPYPNESGFIPVPSKVIEVRYEVAEMAQKGFFIDMATIESIQEILPDVEFRQIEHAFELIKKLELKDSSSKISG